MVVHSEGEKKAVIVKTVSRAAWRKTSVGLFEFSVAFVHRDHKDFYGRGVQDGHLDFHAAPVGTYRALTF